MASHQIVFNPNPLQKGFIESKAKADLFASRMGEGKSAALAWCSYHHTHHNPGADWFIVRDTFENIQRSTQKEFFHWFPPQVMGSYHATKKQFTWASGIAEGTVTFIGMDDPTDASKLMSVPLAGIAIDEPAPAIGSGGVDEMVFDIGMSRLRQPGMKWYSMKLATNNPDETHWTSRKFWMPGTEGFRLWQPSSPENIHNLPEGYYDTIRATFSHRPDLIRRFVDGKFGFQQEGMAVTPQWSDDLHLALGLSPLRGIDLHLLWDFGHNPTCIITQISPLGHWLILEAHVGEGIGVEELIENVVRPTLAERFRGHKLRHIGDPAGTVGEQTSITRNAVRAILRSLGGTWRSGPVRIRERIDPLQAVLSRTINGRGVVQVDRTRAVAVWQALRGGWHYHVARTGVVSGDPAKDRHSHPGDAIGYGSAILFPMGRQSITDNYPTVGRAAYFSNRGSRPSGPPPAHGSDISERPQRGYFR